MEDMGCPEGEEKDSTDSDGGLLAQPALQMLRWSPVFADLHFTDRLGKKLLESPLVLGAPADFC